MRKTSWFGTLVGLGFLLGAASGAIAAEPTMNPMSEHATTHPGQFQRIDQPLSNRVAVTVGGLGLISLELWWFLPSKLNLKQASTNVRVSISPQVDGSLVE
jgi:plastocyanin domain-containing protein